MERRTHLEIAGIVCALTLALCPIAGAQFGGGTGEPNDSYLIYTPEQMNAIGADPNCWDKHFKLCADLDLSAYTGDEFNIIGTDEGTPFTGVFDGAGHTVGNFTYSLEGQGCVGLFGCVADPNAEIKNLGLIGPCLTSTTTCAAGSLVAYLEGGTVANCYVTGGTISGRGGYIGGLIGYANGVVSECFVEDVNVAGESAASIGGLIGSSDYLVWHCHSTGDVAGNRDVGGLLGSNSGMVIHCSCITAVSGSGYGVGGLVGRNLGRVWICHSAGTVMSGGNYSGGLVGWHCNGSVLNCYSTASVTSLGIDVGGLVGSNAARGGPGIVLNCYCTGAVTGKDNVGGLSGRGSNGVARSFWDTETSGLTSSAGGIGLTTSQMQDANVYLDAGWDYVGERANGTAETWQMSQADGYPRLSQFQGYQPILPEGRGTADEPYLISDAWELGSIGYRPRAFYQLDADIDLSGIAWSLAPVQWFCGHLNGNGYVIRHLQVQGEAYLGLFGVLGADSVVTNLGLEDGSVEGAHDRVGALAGCSAANLVNCYSTLTVIGHGRTGGLVGVNSGSMMNCRSTAQVAGHGDYTGGLVGHNCDRGGVSDCHASADVIGDQYVGGLVGYSNSAIGVSDSRSSGDVTGISYVGGLVGHNGSRVTGCSSSCTVWGEPSEGSDAVNLASWAVGGLVGSNQGSVTRCYSAGDVTSHGLEVGGLIGSNRDGSVSSCYSYAAVTGYSDVGGLVGDNGGGRITDGYSTGMVAGDATVGGLIGYNGQGDALNCYSSGPIVGCGYDVGGLVGRNFGLVMGSVWDMELSGMASSDGGVGLTTTEMMDPQWIGLQGWAEDPNWVLNPHQDYPRLAWEDTQGQTIPAPVIDWILGDGTGDAPYEVSNSSQLVMISRAGLFWDKSFLLIDDVDCAEVLWSYPVFGTFTGTFDGQGHQIMNLHILGHGCLGFVGYLCDGGSILNLGLLDMDIAGDDAHVGGFVGYSTSGTVWNCHGIGAVAGQWYVGGLTGYARDGTVVCECCSEATVSGGSYVGGLTGYAGDGTVVCECYSEATVSGGWYVGGLIGDACDDTVVSECHSGAAVTGGSSVGGLIGSLWHGEVLNCHNSGTVAGDYEVGGLVGENDYSGTSGCSNAGAVTGRECVGGLVGENDGSSISNCYNTGAVAGRDWGVGGLVGRNRDSSISNSYSVGAVTGRSETGGLVGMSVSYTTTRSFWDIETSGQTESDGGTGLTTAEMQDVDTYLDAGWDFVGETDNGVEDIWWMEEGGGYPRLWWEE